MKTSIPFLSFVLLSFASASFAHDHDHDHKHKHKGKSKHSLSAHVHGKARLSVALENPQHIEVEIELSGSDAVGFEHRAKTDTDKQKVSAKKAEIQKGLSQALGLATDCNSVKFDTDIDHEKSHSDWEIEAEFHCETPLAGKKIQVNLQSLFPKVESLDVTYVSEKNQKSFEFKNGQGELHFE